MEQSQEQLQIELVISAPKPTPLPKKADQKEREVKIAPGTTTDAISDEDLLDSVPTDWLKQLAALLLSSKNLVEDEDHQEATQESYEKEFSRHLKEAKGLEQNLKLLFIYVTNQHPKKKLNDDEIVLVKTKLLEEIFKCSQGFVERVNYVVISLETPRGVDGQLVIHANALVGETASSAGAIETHTYNEYLKRAAKMYPWVTDPCPEGKYGIQQEGFTRASITAEVKNAFEKHFTLFINFKKIQEKIRTIILQNGYLGRLPYHEKDKNPIEHYGKYEVFIKCIVDFFDLSDHTLEQLSETYMVSDEMSNFIDINWVAVDNTVWEKLTAEQPFKITPPKYKALLAQCIKLQEQPKESKVSSAQMSELQTQLVSVYSPKSCEDLACFAGFIGLKETQVRELLLGFLQSLKNNSGALEELAYFAAHFGLSREEAGKQLMEIFKNNPFSLSGKFLNFVYRENPPLLTPEQQKEFIFSRLTSYNQFYRLLSFAARLNLQSLRSAILSNINHPTLKEHKDSFLVDAMEEDDSQVTRLLIDLGTNVHVMYDFPTESGFYRETLLLFMVRKGDVKWVKFLLDAGVNINRAGDEENRTPLYFAIWNKNISLTKFLLDRGANPYGVFWEKQKVYTALNLVEQMSWGKEEETRRQAIRDLILASQANPPLCVAAGKKDSKAAAQLLANGADPRRVDRSGDTPFMIAVNTGDAATVQLFVPYLHRDPKDLDLALKSAVEKNHHDVIALLLEAGANPAAVLKVAARYGDLKTIQLLLAHKNVLRDHRAQEALLKRLVRHRRFDIYRSLEKTIQHSLVAWLHKAIKCKGNIDFISNLLDLGVNVNELYSGWVPLHVAILRKEDQENNALIRLLLEGGADPWMNIQWDGQHYTIIDFIKKHNGFSVNQESIDLISRYQNMPALCDAALKGDNKNIAHLFSNGVNPGVCCQDNENLKLYLKTPLMLAAATGNIETIKALLANKHIRDTINLVNTFGATALTVAAENGKSEAVKLLMEYGADPNLPTLDGHIDEVYKNFFRRISFAKINEKIRTSDFSRHVHMLCHHAEIGSIESMKELLKLEEYQPFELYRNTPLMIAAYRGDVVSIQSLMSCEKTDINYQHVIKGNTALMIAVSKRNVEAVKQLLNLGANVNLYNKEGNTALHLALKNRHAELVKLLLESGADPDAEDAQHLSPESLYREEGVGDAIRHARARPPLCEAIGKSNIGKVQKLLKNNVNILAKNASGKAPLTLARESKCDDIVRLIYGNFYLELKNAIKSNHPATLYDLLENIPAESNSAAVFVDIPLDQRQHAAQSLVRLVVEKLKKLMSENNTTWLFRTGSKNTFLGLEYPTLSRQQKEACHKVITFLQKLQPAQMTTLSLGGQHEWVAQKLSMLNQFFGYLKLDQVQQVSISVQPPSEVKREVVVSESKESVEKQAEVEFARNFSLWEEQRKRQAALEAPKPEVNEEPDMIETKETKAPRSVLSGPQMEQPVPARQPLPQLKPT